MKSIQLFLNSVFCGIVLTIQLTRHVESFSLLSSSSKSSVRLGSTTCTSTELCMSSTVENSSKTESKRRVVVTGLGVISGCGIGADDFFNSCIEGKSSLGKVKRFDISNYPCQIASEVPAEMFDPVDYFVNPKNAKSNDRFTHFAVAAARLALKDAKMGDTPESLVIDPSRIGVMVGSAFGGMETFEQQTLALAQKPDRPKVSKNMVVYCQMKKKRQELGSNLMFFILITPFCNK